MGRKVRMVPPDWAHPCKENGNPIPLLEGPFSERLAEWEEGKRKWDEGFRRSYSSAPGQEWVAREPDDGDSFDEWDGERPKQGDYMPEFEAGTATHLMMYENTSEGTPISPAFATPEELARWLADTGASAFGSSTATYEQWLATAHRGFAISAVVDSNGIRSGVEALVDT